MNNKTIKELESQKKEYQFLIDKFSNPYLLDKEREKLIETYRKEIDDLKKINEEILKLRWEQLSSQEQDEYLNKYSEE